MKADVIIGAGYGDEGKGYFTDYIASQKRKSVVIRFNGGAQAGHTVITPDNKKHVFGHFTSNLLLDNASAYLSKYFQINPIVYLKELKQLHELQIYPEIACHSECYVSTPFDMLINQWLESSRGDLRHGSCGLGIGETIHRSEIEKLPLLIKETNNENELKNKLLEIRELFFKRIKQLNLEVFMEKFVFVKEDQFIDKFIFDIQEMKKTLKIGVDNISNDFFVDKSIVFEGAQGLMLDQHMGDFPYVTRSNTGLKNVVDFSIENKIKELNVIYATRCYKTRHGAGPLKWEMKDKPYENISDPTNIPNEYQGTMRFAYLDLDVLKETIIKDINSVSKKANEHNIKIDYNIGLTWLNITEKHYFYHKNQLFSKNKNDFVEYIKDCFNCKVVESHGKTRNHVKEINNIY